MNLFPDKLCTIVAYVNNNRIAFDFLHNPADTQSLVNISYLYFQNIKNVYL